MIERPNPENYEVLVATGKIFGLSRKLVVTGAYVPPGYSVARGRGAIDYIKEYILEVKRKYRDPYLVIVGDFNQWKAEDATVDYLDIREADVGITRGGSCIDRIFTNLDSVVKATTLEPLETDQDDRNEVRKSDLRIAFVETSLPRMRPYVWMKYSYRYYNKDSEQEYGQWLAKQDWAAVLNAVGSNNKTKAYQDMVVGALEAFFPLITTRRKSSELPWINQRIRKRIRQRKDVYKKEGRSARWKRLKKITDEMLAARKKCYVEVQKNNLTGEDTQRNFFKNVKTYKSAARPAQFDVRSLVEGKSDMEVADDLAVFFNKISDEFTGLQLSLIHI